MLSIKDFKAGQKVYILICKEGNKGRHIKSDNIDDYIIETTVTKVGRKNVYVDYDSNISFSSFNNREYFRENTDYCINYLLFTSRTAIYETTNKGKGINEILNYLNRNPNIPYEKIKKILEILSE